MKRFLILIKLNIKRGLHNLVWQIIGAIALIFIVGAIAFCGNNFMTAISSNNSISPINLAVIMNDDSLMAQTISDAITTNEHLSSSIIFDFVDEASAFSGLENGHYIAAVIIPNDTVDSILNGTNTPIEIVFPKNSGLEAVIIKEIADAAATLLGSAQAGVYSIYDIYDQYDVAKYTDKAVFRMNLKYISFVVGGSNLFESTIISVSGALSLMEYYICGGIVLFMMLIAINYFSIANRLDSVSSKTLSLQKTPLLLQELANYIGITVSQILTLLIVAIPATAILKIYDILITPKEWLKLILTIFIFTIVSSAYVYFISRLTKHNLSRIMISFICTLVMCFLSGCFIPSVMLPDLLTSIASLLPTSCMMSCITKIMCGIWSNTAIFCCLIWSIVLFTLGVYCTYISRGKELR